MPSVSEWSFWCDVAVSSSTVSILLLALFSRGLVSKSVLFSSSGGVSTELSPRGSFSSETRASPIVSISFSVSLSEFSFCWASLSSSSPEAGLTELISDCSWSILMPRVSIACGMIPSGSFSTASSSAGFSRMEMDSAELSLSCIISVSASFSCMLSPDGVASSISWINDPVSGRFSSIFTLSVSALLSLLIFSAGFPSLGRSFAGSSRFWIMDDSLSCTASSLISLSRGLSLMFSCSAAVGWFPNHFSLESTSFAVLSVGTSSSVFWITVSSMCSALLVWVSWKLSSRFLGSAESASSFEFSINAPLSWIWFNESLSETASSELVSRGSSSVLSVSAVAVFLWGSSSVPAPSCGYSGSCSGAGSSGLAAWDLSSAFSASGTVIFSEMSPESGSCCWVSPAISSLGIWVDNTTSADASSWLDSSDASSTFSISSVALRCGVCSSDLDSGCGVSAGVSS